MHSINQPYLMGECRKCHADRICCDDWAKARYANNGNDPDCTHCEPDILYPEERKMLEIENTFRRWTLKQPIDKRFKRGI
jgi:hypothetical protein